MDEFLIDINEAKFVCPICRFKHEPTDLYSDGEVINLTEILIPNEQEVFLSKLGFKKKIKRRTSKFILFLLIVLMALGAMVSAATMDIHYILKIIVGLVFITATTWQILRYYKEEEIPKWHRKR